MQLWYNSVRLFSRISYANFKQCTHECHINLEKDELRLKRISVLMAYNDFSRLL